jgi:hypothetical protein
MKNGDRYVCAGRRVDSTVPSIDAGARQRLTARFGGDVEAWFYEVFALRSGVHD